MAHDILTAWFSLHTLNHKKRQRTKQKVFHQTKLEIFLQVLILHGLNSSCDLRIRAHHLALSRYLAAVLVLSSTRLPTLIFACWSICAYTQVLEEEVKPGHHIRNRHDAAYTHYKMSACCTGKDDIDNCIIQRTTA